MTSIKYLLGSMLSISLCAAASGMTVTLTASLPSPGYVGQMTTWNASASGTGDIRYRFRVKPPGGDFQIIRDYGPLTSLGWTATEREGVYEIELSATRVDTGEVATTSQLYQVLSRVTGEQAVVNPTVHPLVFLFSAPSCSAGAQMSVEFQNNSGRVQQTPWKSCAPPSSMNFYLAGLLPQTSYNAHSVTEENGALLTGADVTFQTGQTAALPWRQTVLQPVPADTDRSVLLGISGGSQIATDMNGNVIWYMLANLSWATRFDQGGYLWGVLEDSSKDVSQQGIRKIDLTGMTVSETNAAQVNVQLAAMGRRPISGFHHEVRTLSDGRILALADLEQIVTNVQGPGPIDVVGDMIIVFDSNLKVLWTWDTFDHLDVSRLATNGEKCSKTTSGGCPPFYLASQANDWTHGNAVQLTPDGNLLYSARHQDWLIKINYAKGAGDGNIIWKLGKDGDFTFLSDDPYPWFSHQHDGNFLLTDPSRMAVFDNGNLRLINLGGTVHSRGQVLELDEIGRTAKLILNADLGVLSLALGTAEQLSDGTYHFDAGTVSGPSGTKAYALGVDACGQAVSSIQANAGLYRSFRMSDMYTPPEMRKGVRTRPAPYGTPGPTGQARPRC